MRDIRFCTELSKCSFKIERDTFERTVRKVCMTDGQLNDKKIKHITLAGNRTWTARKIVQEFLTFLQNFASDEMNATTFSI